MGEEVNRIPEFRDLYTEIVWAFTSDNGRRFELGKLLMPVQGHERETHALRIVTPADGGETMITHTTQRAYVRAGQGAA